MKPNSRPGVDEGEDCKAKALIEQARNGSHDALGRLLELFRPYLLKVALEELDVDLRVKESPSDMVQKSYLQAFQGFAGFQGDSPEVLCAWLRKILLNNVQDLWERFRTEKRQIEREVGGLAPALATDMTPPSQVAIRKEQNLILEVALEKLAPEARTVIVLRHRESRSFAEIAAHFRITEVAARKRWARAVEELRQWTLDESPSEKRA